MRDFGTIFEPDKKAFWMQSHAQLPVVDHIDGDLYRVYYASRDKDNRSHVGYFEIDLSNPQKVLNYTKDPVLSPGEIGFFDEHGVYASSIVTLGNKKYLYYIGWNKGCEYPLFYTSIGLAISEDGGKTFEKYSRAPILSRSDYDPCLVSAPFVFSTEVNQLRMLYISGLRWDKSGEHGLKSFYHLKLASSNDGIHWVRNGKVAFDFSSDNETNIARASVIKMGEKYHAFFSSCGFETPYRIGYAESHDGENWDRKNLMPSSLSEMIISYPYALYHNNQTYLFYNGKNFGADGIKLMELEVK